MSILKGLNTHQNRAVVTDSKYVRIIAGAGSGKTRVLTTRIAYLIDQMGIYPSNILAITFTNKAANEMKERIEKLYQVDKGRVHISTIHSLCVRILREDIGAISYPKNFTVIDQDDQKSIVKEAYRKFGLEQQKISISTMLNYISGNKGARVSIAKARELAAYSPIELDKANVYEFYQDRLKSLYALDFDDLLLVTVDIFRHHPFVLSKWQKRFNYIHVDEFQDVDSVQAELIVLLAGKDNNIYVVGDPDQTIYSWRGANVNIIMNFEKNFTPCETIILNENYRSTSSILGAANSVIKNNKNRVDKELFTSNDEGEKVTHFSASSEDHEALWVSSEIRALHSKGVPFNKIAILYRSNYMSRFIEKGLLDAQIPYIIFGGIRFYERAEIKDVLSYMRMVSKGDDLAFLRTINNPKRGFGPKSIDKLREVSESDGITLYEALKKLNEESRYKKVITDYIDLIESEKETVGSLDIDKILENLLAKSGYLAMLEANKENDRIENIKELINDIGVFKETFSEGSLDEYLQLVSLYGDKSEATSDGFVQLMTVHAAKGLEFEYVFVVGLSEGIFPSERTMSEGLHGLEEERRLAYVAYTRARKKLFVTQSSGFNYVLSKPRTISRFIKEIDEEYLEQLGNAKTETVSLYNNSIYEGGNFSNTKESTYKTGDIVEHKMFKNGVVLSNKDGIVEIAFDYPHGVKRIMANHPSITKVTGE